MAGICYVDTSALLKRYIDESASASFDAFCESSEADFVISPLVACELASSLQRRVRAGDISARYAAEARRRFHDDVTAGGWRMLAFETAVFSRASDLLLTLGAPLSTLDAMHLASALLHGADALATADRQLATASRRAKLHVHIFQ